MSFAYIVTYRLEDIEPHFTERVETDEPPSYMDWYNWCEARGGSLVDYELVPS
jgi:hypothetical protein